MGKLILIIGCMFSGKSSKLLEYYYKYRLKYQCLLISHEKDDRYGTNKVVTHNKFSEKSRSMSTLIGLFEDNDYMKSNVILIDEGQFFGDLFEFVDKSVNINNKIMIVSGLNGDFQKREIGEVIKLVPEADDIIFQKAICHYCKSPEDAIFSLRTDNSKSKILVGDNNKYVPVCRYHYNRLVQ